MKQYLLAIAVATFALTACKRDPEPTPAPEVAPAVVEAPMPESTATTDATTTVDPASPPGDTAGLEVKAFAGTFSETGTSLELAAEGTYRLNMHAESANADLATDGTWTIEADGRHVLLDPTSKSEADRRYEIVSRDELRAVEGGQSLGREGAGSTR